MDDQITLVVRGLLRELTAQGLGDGWGGGDVDRPAIGAEELPPASGVRWRIGVDLLTHSRGTRSQGSCPQRGSE